MESFGSGLTGFMIKEKLVDKQADYRVVNQNRFGKANRPPSQPLNARSQGKMVRCLRSKLCIRPCTPNESIDPGNQSRPTRHL